jgi:hypothetical protein
MGRPTKGLTKQATAQLVPGQNVLEPSSYTAYGNNQLVISCNCRHSKHARLLQCQSVTRSSNATACHVHAGKGSAHEQEFYEVADREPLLTLYAVEAAAISKNIQLSIPGSRAKLHLNKKRWDLVSLTPPNLLVEVQGEYHTNKQDTRKNNRGDTVEDRQTKDSRLACAAVKEGYSVLWLFPGDKCGRSARWAEALRQALQHVQANRKAKLFKG